MNPEDWTIGDRLACGCNMKRGMFGIWYLDADNLCEKHCVHGDFKDCDLCNPNKLQEKKK